MINPRYKPNKKNGGVAPVPIDPRLRGVVVGCKKCFECRRQKQREWSIRLAEEMRYEHNGHFVTLTFSTKSLIRLRYEVKKKRGKDVEGYNLDNAIARLALERWLDNERKQRDDGVTPRHWFVTELGSGDMEHMHIHGIVWCDEIQEMINKWSYGGTFIGDRCNGDTVGYIVKYMSKVDEMHKHFVPTIVSSIKMGYSYLKTWNAVQNRYKPKGGTNELYKYSCGKESSLPMYLRNRIYSDEEREKLWLEKLDKKERYVLGQKIDVSTNEGWSLYSKGLIYARQWNRGMGYGDLSVDFDMVKYEHDRRVLLLNERLNLV
jgi:hypothetical protein